MSLWLVIMESFQSLNLDQVAISLILLNTRTSLISFVFCHIISCIGHSACVLIALRGLSKPKPDFDGSPLLLAKYVPVTGNMKNQAICIFPGISDSFHIAGTCFLAV